MLLYGVEIMKKNLIFLESLYIQILGYVNKMLRNCWSNYWISTSTVYMNWYSPKIDFRSAGHLIQRKYFETIQVHWTAYFSCNFRTKFLPIRFVFLLFCLNFLQLFATTAVFICQYQRHFTEMRTCSSATD